MRKAYWFIIFLLICGLRAFSQELVGKITDADSAATVLYQAVVTQSQGGKVLATNKTFFDGTYHIKVKPNQTYEIKATYPGRRDSIVIISTDKNGTLIGGTLFLSLHKNGLRLMGYVMDREEDLPIKDVGITIRNVMTRKEDKYFTDVNGYYNLKMDFETNYTFRIDKRSPGILNKYQDTSFNISTIGFNQPLDFKLDIKLGPAEGYIKPRPQYNPYADPDNKNLKPVVQVVGKSDTVKLHNDPSIAAADKKQEDLSSKKEEQKKKDDAAQRKVEQEKAEAVLKAKQAAEKEQQEKLAAEAKKKEQEKTEAAQKAKQAAEKEQQNKLAAEAQRKAQEAEAKKEKETPKLSKKEQEKKQQQETAKKLEQENAEAALRAKAESDLKEKEAAEKKRVEQQETTLLAQKEAERQKRIAATKQLQLEQAEATLKAKAESEQKEKEAQEKKQKEIKATEQAKKDAENKIQQAATKKLELEKEQAALKAKTKSDKEQKEKDDAEQKRLTAEAVRAKKQAESVQIDKADQVRADRENKAIARADSTLLADKQRREQKERDLVAMKKARETAEARINNAKRDNDAKEKAARKESKRLAKELAEQNKQRKKAEEVAKRNLEDQQRASKRKAESDAEKRQLEAKRSQEDQEKKTLQQRDRVRNSQQVRVTGGKDSKDPEYNSAKALQENNEKNTIADWQAKQKEENRKRMDTGATSVVSLNAPRPRSVKIVTALGIVKNGQTEDPIANVSVNIRRLNSIVSQEITTDAKGNYQFMADSGYFYLISFYKDKYDISKQILDLTSYVKPEYRMVIQYLKEQDDFDPNSKMPVIQFEKNNSKLPNGVWGDLEAIVKIMNDVPDLKMKIYGLGSNDEDYPMELSVTRARMIADLMLQSGIKPGRIRINGIGPFRPRSGCVEGKTCTQDQYKLDRVVMYKVIKE